MMVWGMDGWLISAQREEREQTVIYIFVIFNLGMQRRDEGKEGNEVLNY